MKHLHFPALGQLRECNQDSVEVRQVVEHVAREQVSFSQLKVLSTHFQEDIYVLATEKLQQRKVITRG